ncbi:unnamed protein product [Clonostachys solani]|uniref:Uncharacterized protein n=1 Tax=Clonostachys solani TaxID=160281 RepID=A0A9N9Z7T6_9HYPO|nr:unnamed protein product [Clonostachys solani]
MHSSIKPSSKNLLGFFTFLSLQFHVHCSLSIQTMAPRLFVPAEDSNPQTITAVPSFAPTLDERDDDDFNDEQIGASFIRDTYVKANFHNIVNLDKCSRKPSSYYTNLNRQPDCDLKNNSRIWAWVNGSHGINNGI